MNEEEIMNEYKKFEKDSIKTRNLIIIKKIFKILFLTLLVVLIYFLLINESFTYNFFTNNFAE